MDPGYRRFPGGTARANALISVVLVPSGTKPGDASLRVVARYGEEAS